MKKLNLLVVAASLFASSAFAGEAELRQELGQLKSQLNTLTSKIESGVDLSGVSAKQSKLSFGGYGEHHLNIVEGEDNQIDVHRFVMFSAYQFNDKISLQTELEVEHGVAGDGQPGEVEVEQAYINFKTSPNTDVKVGQFLIPVGFVNESHEPDTFYGVERPNFTSRIIPTTWWEAGAMISGRIGENANYDLAVHSGLNVGTDTTALSSIRSGRQKNAEAIANDPAFTARIDYSPVAGTTVGATVNYQHDITQGAANVTAVLSEVHGEINMGKMKVRGVYGNWDVDVNDAAYQSQKGYYIEPSYKVSPKLGVFARYSDLEYASGSGSQVNEKFTTVGGSYFPHKQIALKADYQRESESDESSVNLGIGWSY